jgi:hypothetical protein
MKDLAPTQEAVGGDTTPTEPSLPNLDNLTVEDLLTDEPAPDYSDPNKEDDDSKTPDDEAEDDASGPKEDETEDETEETEEDQPLIEEIQQLFGIEFGENESFEDSTEGIVDMARKGAVVLANQHLEHTFQQFPHLQEYYDFLRSGGDPNKFLETRFPETNFSEVQLKETDGELQERILSIKLKQDGHDDQTVEETVARIKAGDMLHAEAELALKVLKRKQQEEQDNLVTNQQKVAEAEAAKIEEYWDGIGDRIKNNNLFAGIGIPEDEKRDFFNYVSNVAEGQNVSQLILDQQALNSSDKPEDVDRLIANWYILFKKFDMGDVIAKKASSLKNKSLRDRLARTGSTNSLKGVQENTEPVNVDGVDWDKQDLYQEE